MNISMLVLNSFSNDARVYKEAKSLASDGHIVTVFALHNDILPDQEMRDGFFIRRIVLRSNSWYIGLFTQFFRYMEFTIKATITISHTRPHVCHAHAVQSLPACWLASRINHSKLVYDAHEYEQGMDFKGIDRIPHLMQKYWSLPERLFIKSANLVITVSESLAFALVQSYKIPKPEVIINCAEMNIHPDRTRWIREKYGLSEQVKIVLYQGAFLEGRGLFNLIYCCRLLDNTIIVFVGDGILDKKLRQQAADYPQIIFTGRVELAELPDVTASADIGVILTQNTCLNNFYSLPNKLFEYMQAGIPVVVAKLPEIAHIVSKYGVGEVVDPDEVSSIAGGINNLLQNPEIYAKAKANTFLVAERFNWEIESAKLLAIYRKL